MKSEQSVKLVVERPPSLWTLTKVAAISSVATVLLMGGPHGEAQDAGPEESVTRPDQEVTP